MDNFKEIKKFILKIVAYITLPIVITIIVCYEVDVFNVLHPLNVRINENEVNKNYVKMTYILNNPNKYNTFVFGSSRVGHIHVDKIIKERCYNMFYSEAVPKENYDNIKTLINSGYKIDKIYLGVDSYSYTLDYSDHNSEPAFATYEYLKTHPLKFIDMYFNLSITARSIKQHMLGEIKTTNGSNEILYKYGWNWLFDYGMTSGFDPKGVKPTIGDCNYIEETLEDIRAIKNLCDKNDIELIVFTNPMYCITYEASLNVDYYNFLKGLAEITPYYNFSGYNDITTDTKCYYEASHFTPETSDMLIEVMWNGKEYPKLLNQGFGFKVTKNNVGELIETLIKGREEYLKNN